MSKIKTILVPTDFSVPADSALDYAVQLAAVLGASITLYHAFIPFKSAFYPDDLRVRENEENEQNLFLRLSKMADRLMVLDSTVPVSVQVDRGPEHIRLLEYSKKMKTDLIVMGTKGASGVQEVMIGSFTADIMTQATCPVLAVPEMAQFRMPVKITYASGYDLKEVSAIQFLTKMNETFKAEISILHVQDGQNSAEEEDEIFLTYRSVIDSQFVGVLPGYQQVEGGNITESILSVTAADNTDILAISPIRREGIWNWIFRKNFVKSTAHKITIPLLTIPV